MHAFISNNLFASNGNDFTIFCFNALIKLKIIAYFRIAAISTESFGKIYTYANNLKL